MNRWSSISSIALCCLAVGQTHTPIKGTQNIRLTTAVQNSVAMGGVKDRMRCDAAGNIYTPANRGYSSAFGSVVEIMADGKHFHSFSLDGLARLDTGHIEDFDVTADAQLYVLAREVARYSDLQAPVAFGSTYVLRFDSAGTLKSQTRLDADFGEAKPTAIAVLRAGDFLVAGYSYWPDETVSLFADLFSPDGVRKKQTLIPNKRTQASNSETVSSMSVLRAMTVKSGGLVFVLRGSTRDPIYVFSDSGELIRTTKLQPENIEFSSPNIYGHQLVVHQHRPARKSGTMLIEREPDIFPVFDLDSGALVRQFEWHQDGELACYDQNVLTIVLQGLDYPANSYWAIVKAQPAPPVQSPSLQPTEPDIALQFRWIVPCDNKTDSVPLRGDEAARRFCLSGSPLVDDGDIDFASTYVNGPTESGLRLTFTPEGSQKLQRATSARENGELGVVINGELVLRAIVVQPLSHEAVIAGPGMNRQELSDWAARLNEKARRRTSRKAT